MKYPLILALWIGFLAVSFTVFGQDSYYGSATYTPQQLHELLVGQSEPAVIQAFGQYLKYPFSFKSFVAEFNLSNLKTNTIPAY